LGISIVYNRYVSACQVFGVCDCRRCSCGVSSVPFIVSPITVSCHGMCRRMQAFYAMNLPYRMDSVQLATSLQIEIQSLKYVGKSKSKCNIRLLTTKNVRCKQQLYIYVTPSPQTYSHCTSTHFLQPSTSLLIPPEKKLSGFLDLNLSSCCEYCVFSSG
jgi:hypothetical protein